ncbi:primosomal protein N' [Dethiobacter alkaliphilus]|uniref:Replication restart protein PriA n=1 Tax=Dethiobacter alkaliphilus AHT 1 TaxID=555088 RepID=C0GIP9_DETAL|nr:primosomal protein N' [Dethiobacter alkaliphilus]EEG76713.1 primosomal protein N' [Dethiobacter alkaliphilus AHT 1]
MDTFAEIIVSIRHNRLDRPFTYRVPSTMDVRVGSRVVVPFGPQRLEGFCIGLNTDSSLSETDGIKEIEEVLDEAPLLTEELVDLSAWGAARWLCNRVDFLQAMVPGGVRWTQRKWVEFTGEVEPESPSLCYLRDNGPVKMAAWLKSFPEMDRPGELRRLQQDGIIKLSRRETRGIGKKKILTAYLINEADQSKLGNKQALAVGILKKGPCALTELEKQGVSRATVRSLEKRGIIKTEETSLRRDPLAGEQFIPQQSLSATVAQGEALQQIGDALAGNKPRTVLLHGVTGSGKTEVYLQAIADTAAAGRGSIVLVPEIALTPQMIERFAARFGERVAVLHSKLSAGERYDEWCRIAAGEAWVAIGARSAIFAPFRNLGLIILDEEHESTYKQDEAPRYHARDIALWRAGNHDAAVVLGSATPALESSLQARLGNYRLCPLQERIANRPMPPVEIVDMRQELKDGHRSIFSRPLLAALEKVFAEEKQAILLLNRRGYATFVLCRECGHVMRCTGCNVALKFHMAEEMLRCHYCEHQEPYPLTCPKCSGRYIKHFGTGTQKVEEELRKHFPHVRVARLDADTTTRKGAHQKILNTFKNKEAHVLIGTQMVAKGLDFPDVTLVGVITADTAINLPDFRAGERTFQLLTQVAGRAGRGSAGGNVVVQTYTPEHYAILAAKTHDYEAFYAEESVARRELGYPPFTRMVRLLLSGEDEARVIDAASFMVSLFEGDADILGPSPCPIEKVRGQFRWQVVVRHCELEPLLAAVEDAAEKFRCSPPATAVRLSVDVDPQSLL